MRSRVSKPKRQFAKSLRTKATVAEIGLWKLLRARRLAEMKFRRQVPIGPWIVDFVSFEHRLIVEADGSQHADNDRDIKRDLDLTERGFRVMRFWNNDILQESSAIAEAIFANMISSPSPGDPCGASVPHGSPPSPTRGEGSTKSA